MGTNRHSLGSRAFRRKLGRRFKQGDVVTWGLCRVAHVVSAVLRDGLLVDGSKVGFSRRELVPFTEPNLRVTAALPDVMHPAYALLDAPKVRDGARRSGKLSLLRTRPLRPRGCVCTRCERKLRRSTP